MGLYRRLQLWESDFHAKFENLPDTPEGERQSNFYMNWLDHAALRHWWSNLYEIAPGIWRGNHPTTKRWHQLKARGIRSVLNLRAESPKPFYQTEKRICEELGFHLVSVPLSARAAPGKAQLLRLIDVFRNVETPLFMHCKSGADRSGLAAAIYLLVIEKRPLADARKMLSPRFVHLKWTKTGILDAFLDAYEEAGGDFETWLQNQYDAQALQAAFDCERGKRS